MVNTTSGFWVIARYQFNPFSDPPSLKTLLQNNVFSQMVFMKQVVIFGISTPLETTFSEIRYPFMHPFFNNI